MELMPAIDLRDGRCVRLLQGRFDAETHYAGDPLALLRAYRELGAAWLHVVDLDGAREGVPGNAALIGRLAAESGIALQAGGGIRSEAALEALLSQGVARAVLGSHAVANPVLLRRWLGRLGPERIVLALDVRHDSSGRPALTTHGWRQAASRTLWDLLEDPHEGFGGSELRHVLCTDVERDGTLSGPNLELYSAAVTRYPHLAWQASGGVRDAADLHALERIGVAAAVSGRALLEHRLHPEELAPFLPNA
ncbi:MAG TPA: 1-(5-phosphoribosyl)-5-[(5-phosphoribosylamino)methylideneamino] imidazole-4-carboxamide isomerase [Burkholderiales bacterium]|nr:1-(5-phosphoribosyl)-5-[(5-phosphoribosylamino)methylideneamino] imidazole-4-carboxamide isomerase [Burkholderiales bacterium]